MAYKKKIIIKGSGFIARNFKKYLKKINLPETIIYAEGVSNSSSKNKNIFIKEIKKIDSFLKYNMKKKIIYISTCSIFDPSRKKSNYCKNKIKIEEKIKKFCKKYIILRFPEIIGKNNNPYTLSNFIYNKIKQQKTFNLWNGVKRNLIGIDDAMILSIFFLKKYKNRNKIFNIINKNYYKPVQLVKIFEDLMNKKAKFRLTYKKVKSWKIKKSNSLSDERKMKIIFDENYLKKKIKKYYF